MAAQATCSRSTTTATAVPSRSMALRASARAGAPNRRMAFSSSIGGVAALHAATPPARRAARSSAAVDVRSEISYVMVKPDGVQRGLVGEIISRFERKGFKLVGLKLFQATREIAEEHYEELASKPFYPKLVDYILSGPVVAMVWKGKGVVKSARKLIGATNPLEAEPGTIRGDYAVDVGRNVVHGSDSPENGERETALWFGKDGIVAWDPTLTPWLLE